MAKKAAKKPAKKKAAKAPASKKSGNTTSVAGNSTASYRANFLKRSR
jgi:hypothetical protein